MNRSLQTTIRKLSGFLLVCVFAPALLSAAEKNPDGPWKAYYPNGSLKMEAVFRNGKLEGWARSYFENGRLKAEELYENDHLKEKKSYSDAGALESDSFYENGKLSGPSREYYANGSLKRESNYREGVYDGPVREYGLDGLVLKEGEFRNGEKIRYTANEYFSGGALKSRVETEAGITTRTEYTEGEAMYGIQKSDEAGRPLAAELYYEKDKPAERMTFKDGKPGGLYRIYYPSGAAAVDCVYEDGVLKEPCRGFSENGRPAAGAVDIAYRGRPVYHFTLKDGIPEGDFKMYYASGRIRTEGSFRNGRQEGQIRRYYPSGGIKAEQTYRDGVLSGPFRVLDEKGNVMSAGEMEDWRPVPGQGR